LNKDFKSIVPEIIEEDDVTLEGIACNICEIQIVKAGNYMKKIYLALLLVLMLLVPTFQTQAIPYFDCNSSYYYSAYGSGTLTCEERTCDYPGGIQIVTSHTVIIYPNGSIDYGWTDGGCYQ
jgi:hypothetical protein